MLEENFDNLIKLINYSNELHKNQISSIKKYIKKSKSNTEKLFELIYNGFVIKILGILYKIYVFVFDITCGKTRRL